METCHSVKFAVSACRLPQMKQIRQQKFGVDIYWMKDINIIKYVVRVSTIYHVVSSDGFVFVNGKWEYKSSKSELQLINVGS